MNIFISCRKYIIVLDNQPVNVSIGNDQIDIHFILAKHNNYDHILNALSKKNQIFKKYWLIYFEEENYIEKVVINLNDAPLFLDDDVIVGLNKNNHIELWELYKIGLNSSIQHNNLGKLYYCLELNFIKK